MMAISAFIKFSANPATRAFQLADSCNFPAANLPHPIPAHKHWMFDVFLSEIISSTSTQSTLPTRTAAQHSPQTPRSPDALAKTAIPPHRPPAPQKLPRQLPPHASRHVHPAFPHPRPSNKRATNNK